MRLRGFLREGRVWPETGHPAADFLNGNRGLWHRRRQRSAVHHGNTVGDLKEFVDFFTDNDDRSAVVAQSDKAVADNGSSTDIDTPSRLMNQENPRTIENLTSHNKFLKIAARQTAGSFFSIGRLHVKALNDEIGKTSCAVAENKAAAHQRVAGEIGIGRE